MEWIGEGVEEREEGGIEEGTFVWVIWVAQAAVAMAHVEKKRKRKRQHTVKSRTRISSVARAVPYLSLHPPGDKGGHMDMHWMVWEEECDIHSARTAVGITEELHHIVVMQHLIWWILPALLWTTRHSLRRWRYMAANYLLRNWRRQLQRLWSKSDWPNKNKWIGFMCIFNAKKWHSIEKDVVRYTIEVEVKWHEVPYL